MTDIVQQRGHLDHLALLVAEAEALAEPAGDVAHADRVLEAGVQCAGVDEVGHRQLADPAQALEHRRVDCSPLARRQSNHAMDRIADDD